MRDAVVLWDFDGTLAYRPGLWSGCVLEVLDEQAPQHTGTLAAIRDDLRGCFPWHRPAIAHPELCDPEAWWLAMLEPIAAAIEASGVASADARRLAQAVRRRFVDGSLGWELFADTHTALEDAGDAGWRNVILSNHVPELEQIVHELGLGALVERVFTSALTGFEKPHPEAFRGALAACGSPRLHCMVGDNPTADLAGARAVGIPAVLVRGSDEQGSSGEGLSRALALLREAA